jgi:hypothetical protein
MVGIKLNERKIPASTLDVGKAASVTASLAALSIAGLA